MAEEKELVDFVTEDGSTYQTYLTSKMEKRKTYKRTDPKKIESVIPGTVTDLFVKEGDRVNIGTPLLVLESMKMENLIKSTVDGTVQNVLVKKGEHISKSAVMVVLM